jgi:hypothetical protein
MKNGFSTSEFWVTIFMLAICGSIAYILFQRHTTYSEIGGGIVVVAAFLKAHFYALGRIKLKLQEIMHGVDPEPEKPAVAPVAPAPAPVTVTPPTCDKPAVPPCDKEPVREIVMMQPIYYLGRPVVKVKENERSLTLTIQFQK